MKLHPITVACAQAVALFFISQSGFSQSSVEFIQKNRYPIKDPSLVNEGFAKRLKPFRVVLISEMPGTNETPDFIFGLAKALAKLKQAVIVGLDFPKSEQGSIDAFMKSGDLSTLKKSTFFSRPPPEQDGRSSLAMVRLLNKLRTINAQVVCLGATSSDSVQEQANAMAKNLIKAVSESERSQLIVLVEKGKQLNKLLAPERFSTISLSTELHSGKRWACNAKKRRCSVQTLAPKPSVYSRAVDYNYYGLIETNKTKGYDGVFFAREVTAALPFGTAAE